MEEIMKNISNFMAAHPILAKALHTFWQAFVAVFIVGLTPIVTLVTNGNIKEGFYALLALVIASGAAGLSAIKSYIKKLIEA
jgi:hypothetical protein